MSDSKAVKRRSRGGGGAARRAERTSVNFETAKYIERQANIFSMREILQRMSRLGVTA